MLALPAGAEIAKHVAAIEALIPALEQQLKQAEKSGIATLARAFVVLHRVNERMISEEKAFKPFKVLYKNVKEVQVPTALEAAGMDSVPLSEGFRVGTSHAWRASLVPDKKVDAYIWLRANDKGDIIQSTVNASTLSALAKQMAERNEELPADLFNVAHVPNTSVTKT